MNYGLTQDSVAVVASWDARCGFLPVPAFAVCRWHLRLHIWPLSRGPATFFEKARDLFNALVFMLRLVLQLFVVVDKAPFP